MRRSAGARATSCLLALALLAGCSTWFGPRQDSDRGDDTTADERRQDADRRQPRAPTEESEQELEITPQDVLENGSTRRKRSP